MPSEMTPYGSSVSIFLSAVMCKIFYNKQSFAYLLGQYGFEFKNQDAANWYYGKNPSAANQNQYNPPIFITLTGWMENNNTLLWAANGGMIWSSTASDNATWSYRYSFNQIATYPSGGNARSWHFSLC